MKHFIQYIGIDTPNPVYLSILRDVPCVSFKVFWINLHFCHTILSHGWKQRRSVALASEN